MIFSKGVVHLRRAFSGPRRMYALVISFGVHAYWCGYPKAERVRYFPPACGIHGRIVMLLSPTAAAAIAAATSAAAAICCSYSIAVVIARLHMTQHHAHKVSR